MENMTIKLPVTVKAKVTESLKKQLIAEVQDAIKKVDMELEQIEFHARRLLTEQAKIDAQGLAGIRQQIEGEKQQRLAVKNDMTNKLQEAEALELGAEIVRGTIERMATIAVGDNLRQLMGAEILVEDDKVIAFRD